MDIKPIKNDADYRAALKEIESLMMADPDTPEGEKLDVMVTLIETYEAKHLMIALDVTGNPVTGIQDQQGRSQWD